MARGPRYASQRQIAFLKELANERVLADDVRGRLMALLAKQHVLPMETASRSIEWLIRQPLKPGVVPSRLQAMPQQERRTDNRLDDDELRWTLEIQQREADEARRVAEFKMARDQATISRPTSPGRMPPSGNFPAPVGVYQKDGAIYVVKENRQGTRRYAVKLVVGAPRITENGEEVDFNYEKAPGMVYALTEADRMTKADMQDFMLKYRKCIRCGYHLHAAKTIKRSEELGVMVGKRCATKMGLI